MTERASERDSSPSPVIRHEQLTLRRLEGLAASSR